MRSIDWRVALGPSSAPPGREGRVVTVPRVPLAFGELHPWLQPSAPSGPGSESFLQRIPDPFNSGRLAHVLCTCLACLRIRPWTSLRRALQGPDYPQVAATAVRGLKATAQQGDAKHILFS